MGLLFFNTYFYINFFYLSFLFTFLLNNIDFLQSNEKSKQFLYHLFTSLLLSKFTSLSSLLQILLYLQNLPLYQIISFLQKSSFIFFIHFISSSFSSFFFIFFFKIMILLLKNYLNSVSKKYRFS